jgi:hypothetical protein
MEPRKDEANPLTRKLTKILNGGDGGRGVPNEVRACPRAKTHARKGSLIWCVTGGGRGAAWAVAVLQEEHKASTRQPSRRPRKEDARRQ